MATYRHLSVSLWRDPDDVSHCRILSPDKTEWRLISATLCGWRRCFVANQLWLMTRIREEECLVLSAVFKLTRNTPRISWLQTDKTSWCLSTAWNSTTSDRPTVRVRNSVTQLQTDQQSMSGTLQHSFRQINSTMSGTRWHSFRQTMPRTWWHSFRQTNSTMPRTRWHSFRQTNSTMPGTRRHSFRQTNSTMPRTRWDSFRQTDSTMPGTQWHSFIQTNSTMSWTRRHSFRRTNSTCQELDDTASNRPTVPCQELGNTASDSQTVPRQELGDTAVWLDRSSWRTADDLTWVSNVDLRTSTVIPRTWHTHTQNTLLHRLYSQLYHAPDTHTQNTLLHRLYSPINNK